MPKSDKSKAVSSKSKDKSKKGSEKKSESKDKKSSKKDKKSEKGERDKSVKSDKKSSKSASPSKSDKKVKKDKDSKSKKGDLNVSASKLDLEVDLKSNVDLGGQPDVLGGGNAMNTFPAAGQPNMLGGFTGQNFMQSMGPALDRKKMCLLHKQPLRYFCVSCEELICYECTVMGPHNTQLHRISSIDDSFKFRFDGINKTIH